MPRDTNIDKSATCLKLDFQIVHVPGTILAHKSNFKISRNC